MTTVYDWPLEWYLATTTSFTLQSRSQNAQSPWTSRRSVYGPHAQFFVCKMSLMPLADPLPFLVEAFFDRLDGTKGLMRIGSVARRQPRYNIEATAALQAFSDGTTFTDLTGFSSGLLPPTAFVATAALRGSPNLVIGGLLASVSQALRRGDLVEIRPNGIADDVPRLYKVVRGGSTDASGQIGVEIRPRLRTNIAVGDMVVLTDPMSVFHVMEDQNEMEITPPVFGHIGFTLVEALP